MVPPACCGLKYTRRRAPASRYIVAFKFKTTKFNSGDLIELFTKISTHENNPLYGNYLTPHHQLANLIHHRASFHSRMATPSQWTRQINHCPYFNPDPTPGSLYLPSTLRTLLSPPPLVQDPPGSSPLPSITQLLDSISSGSGA